MRALLMADARGFSASANGAVRSATTRAVQKPSVMRRVESDQGGGPSLSSCVAFRVAAIAYPSSGMNAMGRSRTATVPIGHALRQRPLKGQENESAIRRTTAPYVSETLASHLIYGEPGRVGDQH